MFVIDDSASTSHLHNALSAAFPELLKALDDQANAGRPGSYHIGIVTTDLGAPGISCGANRGAKLQQVGAGAGAGCLGAVGKPYLDIDQVGGTANIPAGQDLAQTFRCMTSVGDKGCGFEMVLEAAYRALHDAIPENEGFLRPGAALAVFFLTDEDDCSADPTSDLFLPNAPYGPQNSFRCTRHGITCDGSVPLDTPNTTFTGCRASTAAEGGKLTDVQRYVSFFTRPSAEGGVKDDPRRVLVQAITGPSTPFTTGQSSEAVVCGPSSATCTTLNNSCIGTGSFFANPSVRVNEVVTQVARSRVSSICDSDYQPWVRALGEGVVALRSGASCPAP